MPAFLDLPFSAPGIRTLRLDLFVPGRKASYALPPLVVVIHGGGWREGSRKDTGFEWLADHALAFARIEYRYASEARFPAQLDDCRAALAWLHAHAAEHGYDPARVAVLGTSAGATLALLLGADPANALRAVVAYCGPTDLILRAASQPRVTDQPGGSVHDLLGGPVVENLDLARLASPALQLRPDSAPILFFHGTRDPVVLADQPLALLRAAFAHDVPATVVTVPGAVHCGGEMREGTHRDTALVFLHRHLAPPPAPRAA